MAKLEPLELLSREEWGAVPPRRQAPGLDFPLPLVVVHWSTHSQPCQTTEECKRRVREIQQAHMEERGLDDIAYNFLVGGDGKAYTGRGWEGAPQAIVYHHHPTASRLDIAYIGRDWGRATITWTMLKAALQLLGAGVDSELLRTDYQALEHPIELDDDDLDQLKNAESFCN